jgi:hypothetical protein
MQETDAPRERFAEIDNPGVGVTAMYEKFKDEKPVESEANSGENGDAPVDPSSGDVDMN